MQYHKKLDIGNSQIVFCLESWGALKTLLPFQFVDHFDLILYRHLLESITLRWRVTTPFNGATLETPARVKKQVLEKEYSKEGYPTLPFLIFM